LRSPGSELQDFRRPRRRDTSSLDADPCFLESASGERLTAVKPASNRRQIGIGQANLRLESAWQLLPGLREPGRVFREDGAAAVDGWR